MGWPRAALLRDHLSPPSTSMRTVLHGVDSVLVRVECWTSAVRLQYCTSYSHQTASRVPTRLPPGRRATVEVDPDNMDQSAIRIICRCNNSPVNVSRLKSQTADWLEFSRVCPPAHGARFPRSTSVRVLVLYEFSVLVLDRFGSATKSRRDGTVVWHRRNNNDRRHRSSPGRLRANEVRTVISNCIVHSTIWYCTVQSASAGVAHSIRTRTCPRINDPRPTFQAGREPQP